MAWLLSVDVRSIGKTEEATRAIEVAGGEWLSAKEAYHVNGEGLKEVLVVARRRDDVCLFGRCRSIESLVDFEPPSLVGFPSLASSSPPPPCPLTVMLEK